MKPNLKQRIDFALWSRIHRLPRPFVRWWQSRELRRITREAYAHVPLYRRLFERHGIRPEDICGIADIEKLPVTSKRLFKNFSRNEMVSDKFSEGEYRWNETSGSTGEPFCFPVSRFTRLPDHLRYPFLYYRFLVWQGLSPSRIYEEFQLVNIRVRRQPRSKRFHWVPVSNLFRRPEETRRELIALKPDIIEGRATQLVELARLFRALPSFEKPAASWVVSHGEQLFPSQRDYLGAVFGCEVYERYGLEETGPVGLDCSEHRGFHLNEESVFVEAVDDNGKSLLEGSSGRIVVTYFSSEIFPFIRYDTGDRGRIIQGLCACGISARRILVEGRTGMFLELKGKRFHSVEFELFLAHFSGDILRYQFAKIARDKVELRVIPSEDFSSRSANALRAQFTEKFGLPLIVKKTEQLLFAASDKTPLVIDETQHQTMH